jgi:hypothetical protein
MMMMPSLTASSLLSRIAGDSRKVGKKVADELKQENVKIVVSDKDPDAPGTVVQRAVDEKSGKTTITLYEKNLGTENKEALAAYYLSLEGTKMMIEQKSKSGNAEALKTNAEVLIAANEVAFGIANSTETSEAGKAQLANVRKAIDTDVKAQNPTTGNSDAVEVLESEFNIIGLQAVEARAEAMSEATLGDTVVATSNTDKTEKASNTELAEVKETNSSDTTDKTPPTATGDNTTSTAKPRSIASTELLNALSGITMPTATPIANTASSTDRFTIDGVTNLTREQATANLLLKQPYLTGALLEQTLAQYKVAGPGVTSPILNPNEMVTYLGQSMTRENATRLIKNAMPYATDLQVNAMLTPVVPSSTSTFTNFANPSIFSGVSSSVTPTTNTGLNSVIPFIPSTGI